MAKYSETIEKQKEKYIEILDSLKEKYPYITYRPRTENPNGTKANDICVEIKGHIILILNANEDHIGGTLWTDIIDEEDKNKTLELFGRTHRDPEPETLYLKYRYRPKWAKKWIRYFDNYDDCKKEIEKIIWMSNSHITNSAKLIEMLSRFNSFVQYMDGKHDYISFRDSSGFLGREEDYKSRVAEEARKELNFQSWKEAWIGTGKIADCARKAISKSGNLVNMNQQIDFKNRLDPENPKYRSNAERVLYDIYCNSKCEDSVAFENALGAFGAKYDTIAFLFFLKDDSRYLPISSGHFDKGFSLLEIDYITSHRCSWENYQGFVDIIKEIRAVMENMLPMQGSPRLIDAHSFVWVIQEDRFINWIPDAAQTVQIEQAAEEYIQGVVSGAGGRRSITSSTFIRSSEVVKETRKRAKGVCQYCNQPAPFTDKKGTPYLEVHHVIWLSRGGEDSTANTVALCPNCHTRMHILDDPEDIKLLKEVINRAQ